MSSSLQAILKPIMSNQSQLSFLLVILSSLVHHHLASTPSLSDTFIDLGVHPSKVTIYLASFERSTLPSKTRWFVDLGGNVKVEGRTLTKRDEDLTRDSDYDLLRYMSIEEQKQFYGNKYRPRISGTKNERRRQSLRWGLM